MSSYDKNGYLLEKSFFNQNEIDLWKTGVSYFQNIPEIISGPMKYFEKSQINGDVILNRVENFCDYLPLVKDLIEGDKIQTLLQKLTGRSYVLFKDKINFKLSGGGGFRPHQDGAAFRKFINDELGPPQKLLVKIVDFSSVRKIGFEIKDTNIFVISHKTDELIDKFDRVIKFEKIKGFSKMVD